MEILAFIFYDDTSRSEAMVDHAAYAWIELGEEYSNLERVVLSDIATDKELAKNMNVSSAPTIVFLQKVPDVGYVSISRISGNRSQREVMQAFENALQAGPVDLEKIKEVGELESGEQSEGLFLGSGDGQFGLGLLDWFAGNIWIWLAILGIFLIRRQ